MRHVTLESLRGLLVVFLSPTVLVAAADIVSRNPAIMYRIYGDAVRTYAAEIRTPQRHVNGCVRQIAFEDMTNHRFVTTDRLVQESEFSGGLGVVVNFADTAFTLLEGQAVQARDDVTFRGIAGRRQHTPPPCPNVFSNP